MKRSWNDVRHDVRHQRDSHGHNCDFVYFHVWVKKSIECRQQEGKHGGKNTKME